MAGRIVRVCRQASTNLRARSAVRPRQRCLFAEPVAELDADDIADLDDAPEQETEDAEVRILDQATAARSIVELKAAIETLKALESLALGVRRSGADTKWRELAGLFGEIWSGSCRRSSAAGEPRGDPIRTSSVNQTGPMFPGIRAGNRLAGRCGFASKSA